MLVRQAFLPFLIAVTLGNALCGSSFGLEGKPNVAKKGSPDMNLLLIWKTEDFKEVRSSEEALFVFSYDVVDGFRDIDFHPIASAENWKAMKATSPASVATLQVSPQLSLSELNELIATISTKGGFRCIKVVATSHR